MELIELIESLQETYIKARLAQFEALAKLQGIVDVVQRQHKMEHATRVFHLMDMMTDDWVCEYCDDILPFDHQSVPDECFKYVEIIREYDAIKEGTTT